MTISAANAAIDTIAERGFPVDERYSAGDPQGHHVFSDEEYKFMYRRSLENPEEFWTEQANSYLRWMSPFRKVSSGNMKIGDVRWFIDGKMNVCDNCVDRWAEQTPDRTALIWEGDEPGNSKRISYSELLNEVCRIANLLKTQGVKKGDRVTLYMPMIPELPMTMLACARIGAVHSVVFGGFSAIALRERIVDARSSVVVCADWGVRGGKKLTLKQTTDEAIADLDFVTCNLVFRHPDLAKWSADLTWHPRDVDASKALSDMRPYCPCEMMDSEDLLFMLYTSGSTGKPKGIAHTSAGYLLYAAMTQRIVFDYRPGDVWACVADCGWITGHSYIVYGPLCNGGTSIVFESLPTYPSPSRYWDLVERHRVTQFYTAPTALRALMRFGSDPIKKHDRSSLRILGSVGEPINPEAWRWYFNEVGEGKCPIMDTYWQTETGGFAMTPMPYRSLKPGSATLPFFGIEPVLLNPRTGEEQHGPNCTGVLCFKRMWPGMLRSVFGDHQRMISTYLQQYPGYYLTGDGAVRDKDGYYWITGRIDDVINVSGHRLGSAEIEHALVQHPAVSEAAVIGFPHEVKGEGLFCYVTIKMGQEESDELVQALRKQVRTIIGPVATPDVILLTPGLPKTRSGKIMRRILRKIAAREADQLGDVSTLADPSVVEELVSRAEKILAQMDSKCNK